MRIETSSNVLETFLRMIGSLEPVDVVTSFTGSVTALRPGHAAAHLLCVDGLSVGRAERIDGGFRWLSREALIFVDPQTREPLDTYTHAILGGEREVVHVWNDPHNDSFTTEDFLLRPQISEGFVSFSREILHVETNPLSPSRWPQESSGEMLSLVDLRRYTTTIQALEGSVPSVACDTTRTWITPWVPWMLCGTAPGYLVWHLSGRKLIHGYRSLSVGIRSFVEQQRPEFAFAPRTFVATNESIWSAHQKERRPKL